ncbi:MAG: hemerythrin domain-containing protein [Mycobacterium leprae]
MHTAADERAAQAVVAHHAAMLQRLLELGSAVRGAAEGGDGPAASRERDLLVAYLRAELLPHALAEEGTMYRTGADRARLRLLVDGMVREHHALLALVDELSAAATPSAIAAAARAVEALFAVHLAKENKLLLPALLEEPDVSLAEQLEGMHELLGADG